MIEIEYPYVEPPRCGVRRRHTNATCEMPPGHADSHGGRDSLGRWHFWHQVGDALPDLTTVASCATMKP